jgi:hypothetical protein
VPKPPDPDSTRAVPGAQPDAGGGGDRGRGPRERASATPDPPGEQRRYATPEPLGLNPPASPAYDRRQRDQRAIEEEKLDEWINEPTIPPGPPGDSGGQSRRTGDDERDA